MFGHSAGGLTAAEAMLADDRIDAGVDLDGTLAYHAGDEEWAESTLRGTDRPFLIFGGGVSGTDEHPHTSEHSRDWRMFRDASTGEVLEIYLAEGSTWASSTPSGTSRRSRPGWSGGPTWRDSVEDSIGTVDPERSVAAQRAYLTAFFDEHLRGEEQPLLDGPSPDHPDVAFID
ncbi:hypothetical protein ACFQXA_25290 [Nocardiopsis composta]